MKQLSPKISNFRDEMKRSFDYCGSLRGGFRIVRYICGDFAACCFFGAAG